MNQTIYEKSSNEEVALQNQQKSVKESISSTTKENTSASINALNDYSNKKNLILMINKQNPEFLEKFEVLEYINGGSAGKVYKGVFKGPNKKQVALKFLINEKMKEKEKEKKQNERMNQEIAISKKLHHKNITEIFAYFKKDSFNVSVLEYAKYGDIENFLRNLLKRYVLSETALNYFGKQILEGLKFMHYNKIVHMDVKPGNILVDSNLDIKITDFSVSCQYNTFHPNDLVRYPFVGTGKYISPEILSKTHMKIKDAEKIDVYSFGVTLYYLFYGQYPYNLNNIKGKDYENIKNNIKNEELMFPKERKASNLFKDFLSKTLEKNYEKRIDISEALEHPWIKGAKYIMEEKENLACPENFLIKLITDSIPKFNDYIKWKINNIPLGKGLLLKTFILLVHEKFIFFG